MKIFSITKFSSSKLISEFHYVMFHGIVEPDDSLLGGSHFLGRDLSRPLRIRRSGRMVPKVFLPANSFVVSGDVKDKLEGLANIQFLEVEFSRLVDVSYEPGDFSYYDFAPIHGKRKPADAATLYQLLPDKPELHNKIGRYYELIVPRLDDIKQKFANIKYKCNPWYIIGEIEIELSHELLAEYPLFWEYCTFFGEEPFLRIKDSIDWNYYSLFELEV